MKVKVIKAFRDRITKSILKPGQIIEVTEERFSELIVGPFFVEKIEDEPPPGGETGEKNTPLIEPQKQQSYSEQSKDRDTQEETIPPAETPKDDLPLSDSFKTENLDLEKLNKSELVEYSKSINIELDMKMNKPEMIERIKSR